MGEQRELSVEFIRENSEDVVEESWSLVQETRHGRRGWRADRYIMSDLRVYEVTKSWPDQAKQDPAKKQVLDNIAKRIKESEMSWDEYHMFFDTLEKAYDAFQRGDLTAGRADF